MSEQRIFITGGASGLGRALAEHYARDGWNVCIGDVNELRGAETLKALQALGHPAKFLRCDVTEERQLQSAADWLVQNWGGVDMVVNNAGVGSGGGIAEIPMEDWEWVVNINLLGVVRGCKVFTPVFRKQGHGYFVNIASAAGLIHPPLMSSYSATKAAVVALSETLRLELRKDHIGCSVVCPGFFKTNLTETSRGTNPRVAKLFDGLVNRSRRSADEIARLVAEGVAQRKFHILTHADSKVVWFLKRTLPYPVYGWIVARGTRRWQG